MVAKVRSTEVAARAGVSRTTVSLVLNGHDQSIPEDTRRRVRDAVDELGYVPSAAARALRRGRGHIVLCIAPGWMPSGRADAMWDVVSRELESQGLTCIFSRSAGVTSSLRAFLEEVSPSVVAPFVTLKDGDYAMLTRLGIPVAKLFSSRPGEADASPFSSFQRGLGRAQADFLMRKTCRRFAWVGTDDPLGKELQECRVQGVSDVLCQHGLSLLARSDAGLDGGRMREAVARFEAGGIDAVCAFNDESAAAFMAACVAMDVRIPRDMRVIGIDNQMLGRYLSPSLTTVDYDNSVIDALVDLIVAAYHRRSAARGTSSWQPGSFEVIERQSA
ncbi:MAG: LacI family DNA-binding transcriptional regulator [Bifidobacterium sp.]|jgi:DNA-binding LacI/PurR family transcriptional regulator|nr:LacI family DNA-binding transcriptional regulator [Bifidobacterium sp.]